MASSNLLTNQRLLVTGGGSGFGAEISRQAVNEGAKVVILDVSPTGQDVADEINAKVPDSVVFVKGSVTETAGWEAAREAAVKAFGGVDSVVNNAGWSYHTKPTLDVTLEEFNKTFDLNVKSIFLSVQAIVPLMIKQGTGGTFIQIGSVSHLRPRPGLAWYAASKGTVSTVAKSLATEFADKNIRFNTILPVLTPTGLMEQFVGVGQHDKAGHEKPLGRLGKPQDIAEAVVWLSSPRAQFITGVDLPVDGGRHSEYSYSQETKLTPQSNGLSGRSGLKYVIAVCIGYEGLRGLRAAVHAHTANIMLALDTCAYFFLPTCYSSKAAAHTAPNQLTSR
ncbi:hypothetical protein VHUM_03244 [Vanrija humicola]|uniref:Uncharacterized protein n=1 Tax=Vanrija humicola TaxID=5417 RepID=A0A7D8Z2I6_VANHU|nr:hypothetical protein VHUM_03244 [Vanrija humicola]